MVFTERSAATRNAILSATRRLLTKNGYEGTTIRAVAAQVGIDPSMVIRYYGSKAGLFKAAVDLDLHLNEITTTSRGALGEHLVRHFLSRWEGELSDETIMLLLRSAVTNEVAAGNMRTIFEEQVAHFLSHQVGSSTTEATRRAGLVSSQLLGIALTRYVIALPPVATMDVEELVESISPVLQYYLTAPLGHAIT